MKLCECGCGEQTPIATRNRSNRRWVKGEPKPYVNAGHARRRAPHPYEVDETTGCWVWQWGLSGSGYGVIRTRPNGKLMPAHRSVWEQHRGPLPENCDVDHLCRNRLCVNPEHLEPVTHAENARRGLHTKLTHETAAEIRALVAAGERTLSVAERYGISQRHVYDVASGVCWDANLGARWLRERGV